MPDKLTMREMAAALGVSRSTISAVLNGREASQRISPETAARVRSQLEERGYVQAKAALQLKGGPSDATGILYCGDFAKFSHLVEAMPLLINGIKSKYGIAEITCIDPAHIHDGFRELVAKGVTKLLWIHANPPEREIQNAKILFPLMERMKRLVIYNFDIGLGEWEEEYLKSGIHLVGFNRPATYREAARIFRRAGHSHVALHELNADYPARVLPNLAPIVEPFKREGLTAHGIWPDGGSTKDMPKAILENLVRLHREKGVDCVFVRDDTLAAALMDGLDRRGIRVPEDIAVIGFDGLPMSAWLKVPLTTFSIPVPSMCEKALELLESEEPSARGQLHIFRQKPVLRKSHAVS